jgi:hypothetical protein
MTPFRIQHRSDPGREYLIKSGQEAIDFALQWYDHNTTTRQQRLMEIIGKLVEKLCQDDAAAVLAMVGLSYFDVLPEEKRADEPLG